MKENTVANTRKNIKEQLENAKEFVEKKIDEIDRKYLKKHYQKHVENFGKAYDRVNGKRQSLEKQAVEKVEKAYEQGKKRILDQPLYKSIEKKVSNSLNSIPKLIDLPTKEDIQKLRAAMDTLNANVTASAKRN